GLAKGFLHDPRFCQGCDFDLPELFRFLAGAFGPETKPGFRQWLFPLAGIQERPMRLQAYADHTAAAAGAADGCGLACRRGSCAATASFARRRTSAACACATVACGLTAARKDHAR